MKDSCEPKNGRCFWVRGSVMKDLTGQQFGRLTAIRPTERKEGTCVIWECRCDCGNVVCVSSRKLACGHTRSCGCLQKEKAGDIAKNKIADLTGQRFGRLLAVRATNQRRNEKVVWECRCDCGNTAYIIGTTLKNGNTTSCGCLRKENMAKLAAWTNRRKAQISCDDAQTDNE